MARISRRITRPILSLSLLVIGLAFVRDQVAAAKCYLYSEGVGYACDTEPPPPAFARPAPLADSFLPRTTYVRLHDNIDVYSGPSLSSPVARNVGDGFLFSTVQGVVENEDQRWYMINQGEYVRPEDMHAVPISQFTGLEIKAQPVRPFGWLLVDVQYSREPGAEPAEDTFWLPRYTFFEVYDAVVAGDEWIWYHIGGGRWIRQTEVSLVDVSAKPEEVGENDFWVEIDLYEQSFAAYEGSRMVFAGLVSSGLNRWPTHEGLFQVWSRQLRTKMSGAEGKVDYYFIEDVPHTMYFDNDIALHGAYWHDRFGYKHSHGCVNMPPLAAEWIFNWSAHAPTDLWVWVHISNPHHYFERFDPAATFAGP